MASEARGARAGSMRAEPSAGSRGRAPGQGAKPPEAENLLKYWTSSKMGKWAPFHFFQCFTNCLLSVDT